MSSRGESFARVSRGGGRHDPESRSEEDFELSERFAIGQMVALKADPRRPGPVIEILRPVDGSPRYRVFHASGNTRDYYYEEQLVSAASPAHR